MNKKEKKKEPKKLISWEGFRKELPWILFWILLGIMAYGYYQDKKICDEILADPCDACYKLNQTLMDSYYLFGDSPLIKDPSNKYFDGQINDSFLMYEDNNPNDRSISSYKDN